jgi:hypothetical protein
MPSSVLTADDASYKAMTVTDVCLRLLASAVDFCDIRRVLLDRWPGSRTRSRSGATLSASGAAELALGVNVILTPHRIFHEYLEVVIHYTKYTRWRQNDFNFYA